MGHRQKTTNHDDQANNWNFIFSWDWRPTAGKQIRNSSPFSTSNAATPQVMMQLWCPRESLTMSLIKVKWDLLDNLSIPFYSDFRDVRSFLCLPFPFASFCEWINDVPLLFLHSPASTPFSIYALLHNVHPLPRASSHLLHPSSSHSVIPPSSSSSSFRKPGSWWNATPFRKHCSTVQALPVYPGMPTVFFISLLFRHRERDSMVKTGNAKGVIASSRTRLGVGLFNSH